MAILSKLSNMVDSVNNTAPVVVDMLSAVTKAYKKETLVQLQLENFKKIREAKVETRGIEEFLRDWERH